MTSMSVALLGHNHVCPKVEVLAGAAVLHGGGPIINVRQSFVTVYGVPIATVTDQAVCTGLGQLDEIQGGSTIATINGTKIARLGDRCQHGGLIVEGIHWILFS